uniref:Probable DNA polymerase n=1 Tax=Tricholoma saponaceum TaxID=113602 RepID=A0A6C0W565_9AGAR|nr:LAGLIDADG homing endonuclease [Tricholoma saponaceum]QIC20310.1 LAGLIDADG homing endonuclease [Tricholoma saponaceum]
MEWFFAYILNNNHLVKNIFLHNLGSFDGYFTYNLLSHFFEPSTISTFIDHLNKFIKITLNSNNKQITFLDSLRIFNVELDKLCEVFGVEGKISKFNQNFNNFDLFNNKPLFNKFKGYSLQDSICLYQALVEAQKIYISQYNIDITSILSTSTLSLKIFRNKFQEVEIPILKGTEDNFIRKSYFGGHTDYFNEYAENIYYYDINSLYPFAMCKPMLLLNIKWNKEWENLENLFGFCLAEITTPKNILRPHINMKVKLYSQQVLG